MNIYRDRKRGHLWLTQRSYLEKIANLFDMNNTKVVSTTLANHFKLSKFQCLKTESDITEMNQIPHVNTVDSLMYAMVCTMLDITHVVGLVSKFRSNLGKEHWSLVKWII